MTVYTNKLAVYTAVEDSVHSSRVYYTAPAYPSVHCSCMPPLVQLLPIITFPNTVILITISMAVYRYQT